MYPKPYFPSMDVKQHAWATEELVISAEESVDELTKELPWQEPLTLLFVPLVDFAPSGAYRLAPETASLLAYADGSIEWSNPPKEAAFAAFERESRDACNTLREYLVRLLIYALAHGMDVAKLQEGGYGRSILHPLPHSELHTEVSDYDT